MQNEMKINLTSERYIYPCIIFCYILSNNIFLSLICIIDGILMSGSEDVTKSDY